VIPLPPLARKSRIASGAGSRRKSVDAPGRRHTRTQIVWASFLVATASASGLLAIGDRTRPGPMLVSIASDATPADLQPHNAAIEQGRWRSIVVHHSGQPGGTPESIDREHRSYGYASLGYHFLVGNGAGLGDGVVFAGPRWHRQQAGAHVAPRGPGLEPTADELNRTGIGICVIGDGNRREFTPRQIRETIALVRRLQWELDIPASAVHLHSSLTEVRSPGEFFPAAAFASAILD